MTRTVSPIIQQIANEARANHEREFYALAHHITVDHLAEAYRQIRKSAAAGIDGRTVAEYEQNLEANLKELHARLKSQKYRAPAVKRVWIPKDGGARPLGVPTVEDKIVQRAVVMLLEPIYEADFYDFSYGFRKGRSCHQAMSAIREQCQSGRINWIIDADISNCFGSLNHGMLRDHLKHRVKDGSIHRLIGKWLNAGVLEEGELSYPESGAPQGGVVSPLLMNVYMHYGLDEWFETEVRPRMSGKVFLVRYADDFVIGCEREEDAQRIMEVLPKRLAKYELTVHPTKTRLVNFTKPRTGKKGDRTFTFVGFTFYWGRNLQGYWVVKKRTASKRIRRTLKNIHQWCKSNRHKPISEQHTKLNQKLRGHYAYFGVIGNYEQLSQVWYQTKKIWRKWLNRRGGKKSLTYARFEVILETLPLLKPKIIHAI
jgi:group II intron reverse transcriptase/maturase